MAGSVPSARSRALTSACALAKAPASVASVERACLNRASVKNVISLSVEHPNEVRSAAAAAITSVRGSESAGMKPPA